MNLLWGILTKKLTTTNDALRFESGYINMEFEVITSEDHNWTSEVTTNPIETGQSVSDHIQRKPDTLAINGVISNASMQRWKGKIINSIQQIMYPESAVQMAFDKLRNLMDNRQPVTVYTKYRTYPDMVLTNLSIPRKPDDGDAIEFNAQFTHIKRVSTLTINAEDAGINPQHSNNKNTQRKSAKTENRGKVQATPTELAISQKAEQTLGLTAST